MSTGHSNPSHSRPLSCRAFHDQPPEYSTIIPYVHALLPFLQNLRINAPRSSAPASLCLRRPDGAAKKGRRRILLFHAGRCSPHPAGPGCTAFQNGISLSPVLCRIARSPISLHSILYPIFLEMFPFSRPPVLSASGRASPDF